MPEASIGIIGGTGLYDIDGFENAHPCGAFTVGLLTPVIWQVRPRHARQLTTK